MYYKVSTPRSSPFSFPLSLSLSSLSNAYLSPSISLAPFPTTLLLLHTNMHLSLFSLSPLLPLSLCQFLTNIGAGLPVPDARHPLLLLLLYRRRTSPSSPSCRSAKFSSLVSYFHAGNDAIELLRRAVPPLRNEHHLPQHSAPLRVLWCWR